MTLYKRLAAVAQAQLSGKGRAITLRRAITSFDPQTGVTSQSVTDHGAHGLFTAYRIDQIDGSAVQRGDRQLLIAADGIPLSPDTGDRIVTDGEEWQVVSVETLAPGDRAVLYRLQIRR